MAVHRTCQYPSGVLQTRQIAPLVTVFYRHFGSSIGSVESWPIDWHTGTEKRLEIEELQHVGASMGDCVLLDGHARIQSAHWKIEGICVSFG
jgi:hypothetical protein